MGAFKTIAQGIEEHCALCHSLKCNGCHIGIDLGDRVAFVSGLSHEVICVATKKEGIEKCRDAVKAFFQKLVIVVALLCACSIAHAEVIDVEKLANAIYKAENSVKYPYGIKSIDTHGDVAYARKICINTIKNNIKRYEKSDKSVDYITFLGNRYCPPSIHALNKNWVKNVKEFYYKGV